MTKDEIYTYVTKTIIELLEDQKLTWDKPWINLSSDNELCNNPFTQKHYRGINQFLLSIVSMKKGYLRSQWATYQQIKKLDGQVCKGEKSTPIIFFKKSYIDQNKKYYSSERIQSMNQNKLTALGIECIPIIKMYNVFNIASQTKGMDQDFYKIEPLEPLKDFEKDEACENLINATGIKITHKNINEAYYNLSKDTITSPNRNQFKGQAPYYATILHELGHSTGHPSRLNREFGKFGDPTYSKEELIAELISAYLSSYLGFASNITQNAAYINSWLSILKQDSKAIVSIASQAQKGADLIIEMASSCKALSIDY